MFKNDKPYTAVSSKIDHMTTNPGEATDPAALLELIELIQINTSSGTAEAGRSLRKHIKHGDSTEQMRAIVIAEAIVDNGGRKMVPMVRDTGLGEQMLMTARSGGSKPRKYATRVVNSWAANFPEFSHYGVKGERSSRLAGDSSKGRSRSQDPGYEGRRYREHDDRDHTRGRSVPRTRREPSRSPSRSPSPLNLRGQSLESTIALGHSTATHLVNSMITHDDQPTLSRETTGYYEQAKQIRRRVLRMITDDTPEVHRYLEQLLQVNEDLLEAIVGYEEEEKTQVRPVRRAPVPSLPRRSVSPPSKAYSPPRARAASPSGSDGPFNGEEEGDDEDPFADSHEATGSLKHTPVW